MEAYYKHTSDLDLTLDDIPLDPNEKIPEVPEHLRPTDAMREHFHQNCVRDGIIEIVYR